MRDEFAKIRSKLRSEFSILFFSFSTKLRGHLFVFMSVVAKAKRKHFVRAMAYFFVLFYEIEKASNDPPIEEG